MRWLAAPLLLVVLSGCLQSQTVVDGPDDCFMFCSSHEEPAIELGWVVPLLALLFVVLIVGIIIAAASGREETQQQQQVVIHLDPDGQVRQR